MFKKIITTAVMALAVVSTGVKSETPSYEHSKFMLSEVEEVKEDGLYYECDSCTPIEKMTLKFLQDRGITDKAALATILGNIQQESRFNSNICEGGSRVPYHQCHTGGFGLIQWTTIGRYDGLGAFAKNWECDPSDTKCQLRYMITEREWKAVESVFKTPNLKVSGYMNAAYRWLGWGVHGNRTQYAYNYYNMLHRNSGG